MILLIVLMGYCCGQILTAHLIGKLFYKQDIFKEGSQNPGARNAGRVFGKSAFLLVLCGDIVKTIIPLWIGEYFGAGIEELVLIMISVVVGHMYPIVFSFTGGKGVAPFLGGLLFLSPFTVAVTAVIMCISWPILGFTRSGLLSLLTVPISFYFFTKSFMGSIFLGVLMIIVVIKHLKK
ncbi:glycerol-3-phosphate acyltransferase PlsY [Bacillus pakistanensis]|uniref:Glycerol-3-phosphate acyltransferase n=1 Tax=Rossellomorea pakistanensis TaxID=992288 RepID=A0ABS2NGC9_9BACI|nr:glycerol-3-phosphate acyltransferase [Bacillus pakistanensis]MBM7586889.1 glycerol-3-phosphate acyltransferase PlsY [Bacillus pakistanensis]